MTIVNKKCLDCGKDFEYDEKPGYPKKYCFSCSAERNKNFAEKKSGEPAKPLYPGIAPGAQQPKSENKNTTMYVSYAKDLCIGMKDQKEFDEWAMVDIMKKAIELVKQARREFE